MRILWVKTGPLLPLDTGGKRRTHAMLTEISKAHHVVYLSLLPEGEELHPEEESDGYAAEKIWLRTRTPPKLSPGFWLNLASCTLLTTKPYALQRYAVPHLQERLRTLAGAQGGPGAFDLVVCDFLAPALNFPGITFACPVVLFQHNIEAQIWKRLAASQTSPVKRWLFRLQHRRMRHWEEVLSRHFDGVITVSEEDAAMARADYGLGNVLGAVPTGVSTTDFQPGPPRPPGRAFTMGFLGSMDWMPNIDACLYFAEQILPRIRQKLPDCRFKIIGRNPAAAIRALGEKDRSVEVSGTVADIQPHVHECDVIVVPLKAGGGTRIKIYEAMAMGVPVVSTTIGAEGLEIRHDENILIADEPEAFAQELLRAAASPALLASLARKGREDVEKKHSWVAATRCFMDLCTACTKPSH